MKQSNSIDTRDCGLVSPKVVSNDDHRSTAEVIAADIASENPFENAKRDARNYLAEGMAPQDVISWIIVRNRGLSRADATAITEEIVGEKLNPDFKLRTVDLGDAPRIIPHDPYLAAILEARKDTARYLLTGEMSLEQIEAIVAIRNRVKREHVRQIIQELTSPAPASGGDE